MPSLKVGLLALSACLISFSSAAANTMTLSGEYSFYTDEMSMEMIGQNICMSPDAQTGKQIPRSKNDERQLWFCFSDYEQARKALDIPKQAPEKGCGYSGKLTVEVSDYHVNQQQNDDFDVAKLVKVINYQKPDVIECMP
ncbi:hypothetical protein [Pragia fontium]|uniref:hypothetical protein n=1 Tax=Pragia fontium TaxID=82985 RepID=UPI00069AE456|nr:hypothetical protein [Pragia fontium]